MGHMPSVNSNEIQLLKVLRVVCEPKLALFVPTSARLPRVEHIVPSLAGAIERSILRRGSRVNVTDSTYCICVAAFTANVIQGEAMIATSGFCAMTTVSLSSFQCPT